MAEKRKQHETRYKGMTARVMQSLVNDRLEAGEPLSEAHRAFVADCMRIAIEVEKPPRKTMLKRNLAIAERVDILKPFYNTKPNREIDQSVFDVVAEPLPIGGDAVKKAYYDTIKTPEYLAGKADLGEPDYDV